MPLVQSHRCLTITYITDHKKFVDIVMILLIAQYISVRNIKYMHLMWLTEILLSQPNYKDSRTSTFFISEALCIMVAITLLVEL